MSLFTKIILVMKNELFPQKRKKRFKWFISEKKYLKFQEVLALRKACEKARKEALKAGKTLPVRDWFMIELGLETGLRVEEMANLRCGDLYVGIGESSIFVREGKGGKPAPIKINSRFRKICRWFLEWKMKSGQITGQDSYVLVHGINTPISTRALQKAFKRCARMAGLPVHYSPHSLRHTYGVYLYIASGKDPILVQKQMRHSSVKVTEVYADVIDEQVIGAVEGLYKLKGRKYAQ